MSYVIVWELRFHAEGKCIHESLDIDLNISIRTLGFCVSLHQRFLLNFN